MKLFLDRQVVSPDTPDPQVRLGWLVAGVLVAFFVLLARLWYLQVLEGKRFFERTTDNIVHHTSVPAVRGRIVDRGGQVLADNRPSFSVVVHPRLYSEPTHATLSSLLGLDEERAGALWQRVESARGLYDSIPVLEDVDRDVLALVEQERAQLPGVTVRDIPHRIYPAGEVTAHITGYLNEVSADELARPGADSYEPGDMVGRHGLERRWESYLRGDKGQERYVMDARGNRKELADVAGLVSGPWLEPARPGHTLVLTLDMRLQRVAWDAMAEHPAGAAAVVEVATGRILALVSKPAFDPNVMTGHLSRADEQALNDNPHKPFLDKTLRLHYPPGSTWKIVTAMAALEANQARPGEVIRCPGHYTLGRRVFRCNKVHGPVDLEEAIAQSCNVYFWTLAERIGMDAIAAAAFDLGFGAPSGLALNGDVSGSVPTRATYEARGGFQMGHTLNASIGQGDDEATVLQLAMAYAAVANGGYLWVPQLVDRVMTATGELVTAYEPTLRHRVDVSEATLGVVRSGLVEGVMGKKGTSRGSRIEGVTAAGKTGTAQVRRIDHDAEPIEGWHPHQDHAWFAGYAPATDPDIAVVVLVEHGGGGGRHAAPIAMQIIAAAARLADEASP